MPVIVVATHNPHKLAEFAALVSSALPGAEIAAAGGPTPIENGLTFEANAAIKAAAGAAHTGRPALADDSGLCVDVLGGSPGIFSARWGGEEASDIRNRRLLLQQLRDIAPEHRAAEFVCALALALPGPDGPRIRTVLGRWPGRLLTEERGDNGFGYDPVFAPAGGERSAAQLSPAEKNQASHRARAFALMAPILREELGGGAPTGH
jgi:XTP/dITP diphosphohydrolase